MCAHGFQEGSFVSLLELIARNCLISRQLMLIFPIYEMSAFLYMSGYVLQKLLQEWATFLLFFTREKVPRAFCTGETCSCANSDTEYSLTNRCCRTHQKSRKEDLHLCDTVQISPCAFISLHISVKLCTSARALSLGNYCKETWVPQDFREEFFLYFCSLLFWVCFLAPSSLMWGQPEYFRSFSWLFCHLFLFHRLTSLKSFQERRETKLEDESIAQAPNAVSVQPLFRREKWVSKIKAHITSHHILPVWDQCFSRVCCQTTEKRKLGGSPGFSASEHDSQPFEATVTSPAGVLIVPL